MDTILFVEDSSECHRLVEDAIGSDFELVWAKTLQEALNFIDEREFDLVLLDSRLPDGDGFQLCSMIQTHERLRRIPVILLTARTEVMDKVMAFAIGAEDFITKPFDPLELKARVDSALRVSRKQEEEADLIRCGPFEINKRSQVATMLADKVPLELDLTPIEFRLMTLFTSHPDIVLSREKILDTVWGQNVYLAPRTVDTSIAKLRAKLGGEGERIESVFSVGYRFRR